MTRHSASLDKLASLAVNSVTLKKTVVMELAIAFMSAVIVYLLSGHWEVFESIIEFAERHEEYEVDEILIVGNFLVFASVVFFVRRYREALELIQQRDQAWRAFEELKEEILRRQEDLRIAAWMDPLTKLPNRACLMQFLNDISRQDSKTEGNESLSVLFFDLDRFKQINDLYGHETGDELLREVSRRIQEVLGVPDGLPTSSSIRTTARLGGDEFVAVVRDVIAPDEVEGLAKLLHKSLAKSYFVNGVSFAMSASIGVVTHDVASAELLLSYADAAMYEAKKQGRGTTIVFEPEMRRGLLRRIRLEAELRDAIGCNQLHLHYQPIVSLTTGQTKGVEALLRWTHPELGPISPGEFVPIAEGSHMIFRLGLWVLEESLRQMAEWIKKYPHTAPRLMSVNVSRQQVFDPNLIQSFAEVIHRSGVPVDRIQLEITEDLSCTDSGALTPVLYKLKELGVRLAIDDFGTGTSTFTALERFPVDTLKIDRSLISSLASSRHEASIIHALVILGRNLKVDLVAEGVENSRQISLLLDLGCTIAQGFFFSRPLPVNEIEEYFSKPKFLDATVYGVRGFTELWSDKLDAFQTTGNE